MPDQSQVKQILLGYAEYRRDISVGRLNIVERFMPHSQWRSFSGKSSVRTSVAGDNGAIVRLRRDLNPDLLVTNQVFGYFMGGGWAFGLTENSQ